MVVWKQMIGAMLLLLTSLSAEAKAIIAVHERLAITGNTVCGRDLGVLYGNGDDRKRLETLCLDGVRLLKHRDGAGFVSIEWIRQRALKHVPMIEVAGPDRVKIETGTATSQQELIGLARHWLMENLEKRFTSVQVDPYPGQESLRWDSALAWRVRKMDFFPRRYQCVWMDGWKGGEVEESHPLCFNVMALANVAVYAGDLSVNDEIDPTLISLKLMDVTRLASPPVEPGQGKAYIAKAAIKAGDPLLESTIRPRPAVVEGSKVTIVSKVGKVVISARGTAIEEGEIGDRIRVKANGGEAAFRALVESKDTVTIVGDA